MSKLSGIFSLRNWVAKQLTKPNAEGIMKLPNKGNIDFGEMMLREKLFTNGIDHKLIKDEKQLDELLNYIDASEKQKLKQGFNEHVGTNIDGSKNYFYTKKEKPSAEVIEVDFDKGRWKDTEPEKFFYGGFVEQPELGPTAHGSEALASRTRLAAPGSTSTTSTGLNYLLAEDNDNQRVPFGAGGLNAARRAFLKMMGAGAAGVGAAKAGLFGLLKGGAKKEVVKELTQVPIKNVEGMPAWFKPLVNKVIKEGAEVPSGAERVITHKTKLPNSKTDVYVNQDINNGDVWVDLGVEKHGFPDGKHGQPVRLDYRASEEIPVKGKKGSIKTKEEFNVEEAEFTGGNPENVKFEESVTEKFGEHASNFDEVEMFATGKVKKKTGKAKIKAEREHWVDDRAPEADDFASGGRAGYWIGGKVGAGILKLLKDKKKVKEAYDNIFPTGDYKYDADMVAESLVENNPRVFKNRLYDDLNDAERSAVYGAGLDEASTNFAKMLKMKRAMDKASRPTKTLKGIEETGTINISDDAVAEEFSTFMKETDPVGHAKIQKVVDDANQQLELQRFKTKGRKKNASGGLANILGE